MIISPFFFILMFFVGLFLYSITDIEKVSEIGRLFMFCGLFSLCVSAAVFPHLLRLSP